MELFVGGGWAERVGGEDSEEAQGEDLEIAVVAAATKLGIGEASDFLGGSGFL